MATNKIENVQLKTYEARSYREHAKGDWVKYGDDNLFPNYLVDLYHSSPTHNALCTTIGMMIYGEGFEPADLNAKLLAAQWDLNNELRKCAIDLKIQNGFALEVNWSVDRTVIANISHLPFENLRSGVCDEEEVVQWYYYSRDWSDSRQEPEAIARFNPETKNEYPTQVLYVKPFSVGSYYYPKPDYIGAINYIELEKEISVFHINNIKNGLSPSFAIHFKNGIPSDEERREIRRDIERQAAGAQNAGKFWMTFSDEPDRAPTIEAFTLSDADKQYQFLSEETTAKIMIGHRVTNPQMFGVMVAGKLGGGTELEASMTLFEQQVIIPYQQVIEEAVKTLLNASGVDSSLVELAAESFTDYPDAIRNNAKRGIELNENQNNKCATQTGKVRAQQLANGEPISLETVKRMYSYLSRAEEYYDENDTTSCGTISYLLWGGKAALGWSRNLLRELGEIDLSEEHNLDGVADYLEGLGEQMGDDWELIDEREVDYDREEEYDALWTFARTLRNNPQAKSSQDNEIVRVRYAYAPTTLADGRSRDFCTRMIQAMKVYRKEDIMQAGSQAVNPGWGPNGADTYDIWLYKGGGSCRHFWMRQTYLKRNNDLVSVNEAKRLIQALPPDERKKNKLEENDRKVAQRPRDMKNRGFLKPRKFTTPR